MVDQDQAFFEFAAQRGVISALEAETLRTELQRKRSQQRDLTAAGLLIHKGHVTDADGAALLGQFQVASSVDTLLPTEPEQKADTLLPSSPDQAEHSASSDTAPQGIQQPDTLLPNAPDQTEYSPAPETNQQPVLDETGQAKRPTTKRPSEKLIDSRAGTDAPTRQVKKTAEGGPGKSTTNRVTNKVVKNIDWSNLPTDALSATDKIVPAGTIISGGNMSIAEVREQAGLDDGVKLISNKMDSTVAHLQPDAAAEQRRYVVIREIARGGMGKVLEVEDTELRRSVALKVLRKELIGRPDIVERFLEEAQITGQLEHPNIVPVHEMGVDGAGNLYFTMKYVEGMSLAELLLKLREGNRDMQRDYPLSKLLDIFIRICESISFAHNRGVIHRDLKPANIMVGRFGEVQVMDWGVAKVMGREVGRSTDKLVLTDRLDANSANTMAGAIIGTPSYMSPEQAKGDIGKMGASTDIFSLGVILYEMLSQRSPWTGKTSDAVLEQVREWTPDKPNVRNTDVSIPAELSRLAMRCLEKEPEDRLVSVKELGQNIRNYIEGRTMGAVDYSAAKVFTKWVSRHRGLVAAAIGGVLLVVGAIFGTQYYLKADKQSVIDSIAEEARTLEASSRESLTATDYNAALIFADDSLETWQKAQEMAPNDEDAKAGIANVKELRKSIREERIDSLKKKQLDDQVATLLQDARADLANVKDSEGYFLSKEALMAAWEKTGAVLAIRSGSPETIELRAQIALKFGEKALQHRQYDVCRFWADELKETGLLPEKHKDLYARWQDKKD
ncbi:serine/threonine-protein kinase [Planctomycetota bacterium]|nr:serine/threonine-protein kinase [Planctomycetota bacterium]